MRKDSNTSEDFCLANVPVFVNPEHSEYIEPAKLAKVCQATPSSAFNSTVATPPLSNLVSQDASSDELYPGFSAIPGTRPLASQARTATHHEHDMTIWDALFMYKKAVGWSILLSLALVMEGFDMSLIGGFISFPSFRRDYGILTPDGSYQVTPAWQAGLYNSPVVGEIIGLVLNGILCDRYGNRAVMIGALASLSVFIFSAFFAKSLPLILFSQILCGIPLGIFQALTSSYAAEVMPVALRAYLTSSINLCWILGQITASGMLRSRINITSEWSYRLPFAIQWCWVIPILLGVLFGPESPWWLVKHERPNDAREALLRLRTRSGSPEKDFMRANEAVALMQHTNVVEKHLQPGTGYLDCFRGSDLHRTEIACCVYMTQCICGLLVGYSTFFYQQAGLLDNQSFNMTIAMYGAGILGVFVCWTLMHFVGRRTLYLWGTSLIAMILLVGGCLALPNSKSPAISWTLGSLLILIKFVYDSTVGPVCFALVSEIPSTRLRVKTVVLARISYNILSVIDNVFIPRLLNPLGWNWKGKTCLLCAGFTALAWMWCWFRLPEPKGLTFMELDILFEKNAGAKSFKKVRMALSDSGYFDLAMQTRATTIRRGI